LLQEHAEQMEQEHRRQERRITNDAAGAGSSFGHDAKWDKWEKSRQRAEQKRQARRQAEQQQEDQQQQRKWADAESDADAEDVGTSSYSGGAGTDQQPRGSQQQQAKRPTQSQQQQQHAAGSASAAGDDRRVHGGWVFDDAVPLSKVPLLLCPTLWLQRFLLSYAPLVQEAGLGGWAALLVVLLGALVQGTHAWLDMVSWVGLDTVCAQYSHKLQYH
jgi:hypothetical protein